MNPRILTAARVTQARETVWSEIDLERAVWTVAAARMKGRREGDEEHRVPLTKTAVALLRAMPHREGYVFLNRSGGVVSDTAVKLARNACGSPTTTHGFRTSFTTWAQDCVSAKYREEVFARALAHAERDESTAAYAQSALFDKRRELMGNGNISS